MLAGVEIGFEIEKKGRIEHSAGDSLILLCKNVKMKYLRIAKSH